MVLLLTAVMLNANYKAYRGKGIGEAEDDWKSILDDNFYVQFCLQCSL
ncbi:MAG: hypothetical protein LBE12_18030 [Planctomycetaceae bacterium]|jgi:hypothetical protein|nr:hypothetical protein [Planctomycetaceae bacterium]